MHTLLGLSFLIGLSSAGTAADLGKQAVALGVTILKANECASLATCMETPMYDQKNVDKLKESAIACAMNPKILTMSKIMTGTAMLNDFNKCLSPDSWNGLLTKVIDIGYPIVAKKCIPMNDTLTTWKKNKKTKANCIKDGYDLILKQLAVKDYIDNVGCQIRKKLSNKEIGCILTAGKKVIKIDNYKCATSSDFC